LSAKKEALVHRFDEPKPHTEPAPGSRGRTWPARAALVPPWAIAALLTVASAPRTAPAAAMPTSDLQGVPSGEGRTSTLDMRRAAGPGVAPAAMAPAVVAALSASDPWSWLARARRSVVEAGPTTASFTQTYVPAGFTSGEKETGSLALHLPDCLRWDYQEPYPKGFLLCGEMVHAWNPEDHTGRRYRVDRKREPGLDLLLLGVDDLKTRYNAATRSLANGQVEIALSPKGKQGELSDASLAIDPGTLRVVEVSYHDREGNLTRFQIGDYRPLSRPGHFSPPPDIQWQEQP
jgi:outer membrane lipoprotein-sorting protein